MTTRTIRIYYKGDDCHMGGGSGGSGGSGSDSSEQQAEDSCPAGPMLGWPVASNRIRSHFTARRQHPVHKNTVRAHNGVDIGAPRGTPVYAAGWGVVDRAGMAGDAGNRVALYHDAGWQTRYLHLDRILVRAGQWVSPQTVVGTVGTTGASTGPHLHFELINPSGTPVDPVPCF